MSPSFNFKLIYILSTAILGRCLPIGTMTNKEGANQTVVSKEDTESGEAVSAGTLTKVRSLLYVKTRELPGVALVNISKG